MWRAFRPVLYNQTTRYIQTLHRECILTSHPWLLKESCRLLRKFPGLVETTASYCTKGSSDVPDTKPLEMSQKRRDIINRLFDSNPNLQADIVAKMIEESKYYEENTLLEMKEVKEDYLLTDSDLKGLKSQRRKTPYSSRELLGQKFIYVFYKTEVEKLALKKYGNMEEIEKLKKIKEAEEKRLSVKVNHFYGVAKRALLVKDSLMSTGGVVLFAFTINGIILLFKLRVYLHTGSQVVFAEVVHSFVDLLNQFMLLIGQVISNYPADDKFPYGHRNYLYISSMGSGGFIFAFGCMATLLFGVFKGFFADPAIITYAALTESLVLLGGSGIAELGSLTYALVKYYYDAKARKMSLWKCIQEGDDPLGKVVIMEDSASVIGTIVCAVAMTGQYYFGSIYGFPVCDMLGNLMITGMLGYVSKVLLSENSEKLVGKSLSYEDMITDDIRRYRFVNGVFDIKSIDQDKNSRFKAEIELDAKQIARYILETSADQQELLKLMQGLTETEAAKVLFVNYSEKFYSEIVKFIDDLEEDLKKKYPEVRHIDIELSGGQLPEELKVGNVGQTKK